MRKLCSSVKRGNTECFGAQEVDIFFYEYNI